MMPKNRGLENKVGQCGLTGGPASKTLEQHSTHTVQIHGGSQDRGPQLHHHHLRVGIHPIYWRIDPMRSEGHPFKVNHSFLILPCKTNRQYFLTCKVNRYCLLPLRGSTVEITLTVWHIFC